MERHWALLFEDQESNADLVIEILDEFRVDWVSTVEELEKKIKDEKYRVIITDVQIGTSPKYGYVIVDELRRKHHKTRVPVVVYSTVVNIDETRAAQGKLFYDYVDRNDPDQRRNLRDVCRRAVEENTHTVSWNAWEASFDQHGLLDETIPKSSIPDTFIMGIHLDNDPTVRQLLGHIKGKDTDDEVWNTFEKFLSDFYNKHIRDT